MKMAFLEKLLIPVLSLSLNVYAQDKTNQAAGDSSGYKEIKHLKSVDSLSREFCKEFYIDRHERLKKEFPCPPKQNYSGEVLFNFNDEKYFITKKSEEEGVKDIKRAAEKQSSPAYEEAWLYLPEEQLWYEIGTDSDPISVRHSIFRIGEALKQNEYARKLIFYHNHPGNEGYDYPSPYDLILLAEQNARYTGTYFWEYEITGKIIAQNDLVEYALNSKGKEEVLKNGWFALKFLPHEELYKFVDIKCTEINY